MKKYKYTQITKLLADGNIITRESWSKTTALFLCNRPDIPNGVQLNPAAMPITMYGQGAVMAAYLNGRIDNVVKITDELPLLCKIVNDVDIVVGWVATEEDIAATDYFIMEPDKPEEV